MASFSPRHVRRGEPPRAGRWNAHEDELVRLGRVRTGPGIQARSGPWGTGLALDLPELVWVRLTGTAGGCGGYPYVLESMLQPVQVTSPGSHYSYATATVTGGGGTGLALTLTVDPVSGTIVSAVPTPGSLGTNYTSAPSVAVAGDGTGGAVVINYPWWADSPVAGNGSNDAAYEVNGNLNLAGGAAVYPAIRAATSGKLVFFGPAFDGLTPAFVTSANVSRATLSGTTLTYGSGTVTFAVDTGTTLTTTGAVTTGVTVYNAHDKQVAQNALVWLAYWNAKWWVVDVWSCTALS